MKGGLTFPTQRGISLLFFTLALYFALSPAARAQSVEGRGKVTEVHSSGSARYPEAAIVAASGVKPGDLVGKTELQAAADHLASLGPLTNVRYRFTTKDDKLTIEFLVEDAPTVPVWFDNFPWFTDQELTNALKAQIPLFDGTASEQGSILDSMTDILQQTIATRGVRGSVTHTVVAAPGGEEMIVEFAIEGTGLTVNDVQFGDPLASNSPHVRSLASELVGKPYSRFATAVFINEQVRPLYLEKGCLRAKIGPPEARFSGAPSGSQPTSLVLVIPIQSGPVFLWDGVDWSMDKGTKEELDGLVPLVRGNAVNGLALEGMWHQVEAYYAQHGYLDAKVMPQASFDDAKTRVHYTVKITAGPQYHMADLIITGLSLTAEQKVRDAWRIQKGQIFDRVYFDDFLDEGLKKAFGDYPVHYEKVGRWLRTHPETATVDVLIDFP